MEAHALSYDAATSARSVLLITLVAASRSRSGIASSEKGDCIGRFIVYAACGDGGGVDVTSGRPMAAKLGNRTPNGMAVPLRARSPVCGVHSQLWWRLAEACCVHLSAWWARSFTASGSDLATIILIAPSFQNFRHGRHTEAEGGTSRSPTPSFDRSHSAGFTYDVHTHVHEQGTRSLLYVYLLYFR